MGLMDFFKGAPSLEEGLEKMKDVPNAVLLDVRSEQEYKDGHLEGSINMPINKIAGIDISKDTPRFVYCLSGARAGRAVAFLQKIGYDAVNLGGISNYKGALVRD